MHTRFIQGFSKFDKTEKTDWLVQNFTTDPTAARQLLHRFNLSDAEQQRILDGFSENTVANFPMPFGIAPNFIINGRTYAVPMVIEESSVVAAASAAAKYWSQYGGFQTRVLGTEKVGQVHFCWRGNVAKLRALLPHLEQHLRAEAAELTTRMERRGGGILGMELLDFTEEEPDYYQLRVRFDTRDSMGANFINSVLERFGSTLRDYVCDQPGFTPEECELRIIMCILSNYTPQCTVRAEVRVRLEELQHVGELEAREFADRIATAVRIARLDPYRAVTHNKGIYNGIDAVILATGNDFRAIEAAGHAYAARDGRYRSLSQCTVEDGEFRMWLDVPLALGTVGGLTKLHPLAKLSLDILGNPSAEELMQIVAAVGLAQNFAAVRSLVTTGIQRGHMKMHLQNILNHLGATPEQCDEAVDYFAERTVSFGAVRKFLTKSEKLV